MFNAQDIIDDFFFPSWKTQIEFCKNQPEWYPKKPDPKTWDNAYKAIRDEYQKTDRTWAAAMAALGYVYDYQQDRYYNNQGWWVSPFQHDLQYRILQATADLKLGYGQDHIQRVLTSEDLPKAPEDHRDSTEHCPG